MPSRVAPRSWAASRATKAGRTARRSTTGVPSRSNVASTGPERTAGSPAGSSSGRAAEPAVSPGPAPDGPEPTATACAVPRRQLASRRRGELQVEDPVVVELRARPGPRGRGRVLGEQPRAGAAGHRVHEQVQLVDEAVGQQGPDQGGAAA